MIIKPIIYITNDILWMINQEWAFGRVVLTFAITWITTKPLRVEVSGRCATLVNGKNNNQRLMTIIKEGASRKNTGGFVWTKTSYGGFPHKCADLEDIICPTSSWLLVFPSGWEKYQSSKDLILFDDSSDSLINTWLLSSSPTSIMFICTTTQSCLLTLMKWGYFLGSLIDSKRVSFSLLLLTQQPDQPDLEVHFVSYLCLFCSSLCSTSWRTSHTQWFLHYRREEYTSKRASGLTWVNDPRGAWEVSAASAQIVLKSTVWPKALLDFINKMSICVCFSLSVHLLAGWWPPTAQRSTGCSSSLTMLLEVQRSHIDLDRKPDRRTLRRASWRTTWGEQTPTLSLSGIWRVQHPK